MKRDMDFVRQLLLEIEGSEHATIPLFNDVSEENKKGGYHVRLLINAGYLDGNIDEMFSGNAIYSIRGLTWKGHELLDDIRDDTVWGKTKEKVGGEIKSTSIEIIREVAKSIIKGLIGLP